NSFAYGYNHDFVVLTNRDFKTIITDEFDVKSCSRDTTIIFNEIENLSISSVDLNVPFKLVNSTLLQLPIPEYANFTSYGTPYEICVATCDSQPELLTH